MRIDIIWNQETTTVDLADGLATVGGSAQDGIFIEGLPHGLLALKLEGKQLSVTARRSVRVGETLFPARVPRLLVEGEALKLPNDVVLRRVIDQQKRDSRKNIGTAFVAQELLSGELNTEDTRAATFTCVTGLDAGRVFPVPFDENVIGRADDAAIRIRDRAVSRHHARLVRDGRDYKIQLITSSMNGVYVNGLLLKKDILLKSGDVVEMGQTIVRFETSERAPEERTALVAQVPPCPQLQPSPVTLPQAAAPSPRIDVAGPGRLSLETLLMSAGIALTLLGVVAAGVMALR